MAERDRSQGFGFMYVNVAKLLTEQKDVPVDSPTPVLTNNVRHANFNKDGKMEKTQLNTIVAKEKEEAVQQIKQNLDRLQSLHHKLHAMLEEINKNSDSKKKS